MANQNPKPLTRTELEAALDARMKGDDVLKLLPNPAMAGFNAGREARNAVGMIGADNED